MVKHSENIEDVKIIKEINAKNFGKIGNFRIKSLSRLPRIKNNFTELRNIDIKITHLIHTYHFYIYSGQNISFFPGNFHQFNSK